MVGMKIFFIFRAESIFIRIFAPKFWLQWGKLNNNIYGKVSISHF